MSDLPVSLLPLSHRQGPAVDVLEGQGQLECLALVPIAPCKEMNLRLSKISFLRIFEAIFEGEFHLERDLH